MRLAAVRRLGALAFLLGLALSAANLAPALAGDGHPAGLLARSAFAPTCHQLPERSHVLAGASLASCARCTGLHASAVLGGLLVLLLPATATLGLPGARRLALLGVTPLLIDFAAGAAVAGWDQPWLRTATGLVAGCALLLCLRSPRA